MPNPSKTVARIFARCLCAGLLVSATPLLGQEGACPAGGDLTPPVREKNRVVSRICAAGKLYELVYAIDRRTLSVATPASKRVVVERTPVGFEPEHVGAEQGSRFLPVSLQPSLDQGEVLYLSARRSTGGDGMGQCGAGVEKHLNVLRINEKRPQVVARLLITSCWRGIELAGLDGQDPDPLSAFSIVNGRLRIQFINYEGQGSVTAELSDDRRHLLIIPEEKPTLE